MEILEPLNRPSEISDNLEYARSNEAVMQLTHK